MGRLSWKGGTLLSPVPPVLVSCGDGEISNVITVAWTGIINTLPPKTYISVRPERYSFGIIEKTGEFTINLMPAKYVRAVDFCGVKSGRDTDKIKECGLHFENGAEVSCPMIAESPLTLECKVFEKKELGSHTMFLADIVSCNADSGIVTKEGKLCLDKAGLLAYSHGEYYKLGEKIGSFGFSVMKKSTAAKKRRKNHNGR
ncbi:MAG: flavin reductase family protein [Acutalibacteraceae bacterium]